tara:strand:- start:2958 stop:3491 length:534 start_codon:yes stop_codon:yes gene_type:complete
MGNILQNMMGMLTRKKIATPKADDYVTIARYANAQERLKPNPKIEAELVTMSAIKTFVNAGTAAPVEAKLIPFNIVAGAAGSSTIPSNYNLIDISWDGLGNGTYTLNLPTAASMTYRNIRIITDGTLGNGAQDKIDVTPAGSETIDGAASFEISKRYEGISIWSNGTEWIIIQVKSH